MSAHPFCLAAVPYKNEDIQAQKPLTMCLYVNSGGKKIPNDFKDAAHETFANYEVIFDDFYKRPRCKPVTSNKLPKNEREKKLSEANKAIERILHLFEDRLNVTALQASFRVVNSIEQEIPCVRVLVVKKGSIPVGENAFPRRVEEIGLELDVAEGYFQPAHGPTSTNVSPLRGGAQISVRKRGYAGTLGGFLEDDEGKHYIISCQHILYDSKEGSIVHPATGNSRLIGNYVGGFKGGVEGIYWVDAAIAELEEEEVRSIKSSNNGDGQCSLYGFEESTLKGQIGDVNELSSEEAGALEFTKIGQKTGLTNSGILIRDLRIKRRDQNQQKDILLSSSNCIIVSSDADEPFCDEGDSGSLFFDNDGRAWGVYCGVYNDLSKGKTYHLASFLRKCLQILEKETKKNNLHLW